MADSQIPSEDAPASPEQKAQMEQAYAQMRRKMRMTQLDEQINHKIMVLSGKGGVGKSTVSVGLALSLARQGKKVGLMDIDITGPNVPKMLGIDEAELHVEDGQIFPAIGPHGVKVVSMAFFQQKEDEAIIWRGPMIHNAINQFLQMTDWGDLDYLIVDMPPGTSDAPLTIMQALTMDGFIVVTTPQALAAMDAKRSINMIKKLNTNVLGIVENFTSDIFGSGAGEELSAELNLPFLGSIALRPDYRDQSQASVLINPEIEKEFVSIWESAKSELDSKPSEDSPEIN